MNIEKITTCIPGFRQGPNCGGTKPLTVVMNLYLVTILNCFLVLHLIIDDKIDDFLVLSLYLLQGKPRWVKIEPSLSAMGYNQSETCACRLCGKNKIVNSSCLKNPYA